MFLQETKTKRGGKTYISYLVRESFRTANGPRGRTICNLTHLPKEVRDMVGQALKGESLVPLEKLEINNIHSCGGCVVLEDAARRFGVAEWLSPLEPRNGALVRAMMFGGLLTAPSVAPFFVEARTARLAMFCGLDPDTERFDAADLTAALRQLDERWADVRSLLLRPPHTEALAMTIFRTSPPGKRLQIGAVGMDGEGIPIPLKPEKGGAKAEVEAFLQQLALRQSKGGQLLREQPLLALDEETAAEIHIDRLEKQPWLIELAPESLAGLLRQLNQAQLAEALRTGRPLEARRHGARCILAPIDGPREAGTQEAQMRMGSLKELTSMTPGRCLDAASPPRPAPAGALAQGTLHGVTTNLSAERLPAETALQWAHRARVARAAFAPVQIVVGRPASGEGVLTWRNHQNLQFLTHRLGCHLHAEWSARGETRPVEDVLRDLQEVHRATLTVNGVVVRRLATQPSNAVAALLARLNLWELFETGEQTRNPKSEIRKG